MTTNGGHGIVIMLNKKPVTQGFKTCPSNGPCESGRECVSKDEGQVLESEVQRGPPSSTSRDEEMGSKLPIPFALFSWREITMVFHNLFPVFRPSRPP